MRSYSSNSRSVCSPTTSSSTCKRRSHHPAPRPTRNALSPSHPCRAHCHSYTNPRPHRSCPAKRPTQTVAAQLLRGVQDLSRRRSRKLFRPRALNPVLSAPPIPFCYLGTFRETLFRMEMFQGILVDMNPCECVTTHLPNELVRCPPSTLVVTARPYPFSDPTLTKRWMKRQALLDYHEVLRLYGQASTNPPCIVLFFLSCQCFETEIIFSRCTVGHLGHSDPGPLRPC